MVVELNFKVLHLYQILILRASNIPNIFIIYMISQHFTIRNVRLSPCIGFGGYCVNGPSSRTSPLLGRFSESKSNLIYGGRLALAFGPTDNFGLIAPPVVVSINTLPFQDTINRLGFWK
jgi:hypothetical protein